VAGRLRNLYPRRRPRPVPAAERATGLFLIAVLVITAGLFLAAGARPGPAGLPEPVQPAATGPLPLTSPAGWPRGQIERYDADTLFEKIDGKADGYLAYDFAELSFASYARPDDPAGYVDIYLYDMSEGRNAYGIYRSQRSGEAEALEAGEEGCTAGASAFFRKGPFYVEVIGSGEDTAGEARALAIALGGALPEPAEPVRDPEWFPREGLAAVHYVREGALMVEALREAFLAVYEDGSQVVVAPGGEDEASEARETFGFLKKPAAFAVVGSRVVGVVGAPDTTRQAALLAEVTGRLEGEG
jgi:hypothetical protein